MGIWYHGRHGPSNMMLGWTGAGQVMAHRQQALHRSLQYRVFI
jgi:hypothetical protein